MSHRDELIGRLHAEDERLGHQIDGLEDLAGQGSTGGIREFRRKRVEQLRHRQAQLRERLDRVANSDEGAWEKVQHEAEGLWDELKEFAIVAANTFH